MKEYGSWSVFFMSFLGGWAHLRSSISAESIIITLSLAILMNSKVALQGWIRRHQTDAKLVFILQVALATILLLIVLIYIPFIGFFYFIVPIVVLILVILRKDHTVLGELIGFGYLCLPAPMILVLSGSALHWKIYFFLWAFYGVSVFKVRYFMRKTALWRTLTFFSPAISAAIIALIGLNPLYAILHIESSLYALGIKRKGLAYVGWTELIKAVLFTSSLWFMPLK